MFCRYYRWKLAQALHSEKPLPRLLDRHVQRCNECRSFYELQQEISERLGRDAVVSQIELSEAFKQKIMNAIIPGKAIPNRYEYSPEGRHHLRRILTAACVGLVLLGSILLWLNHRETSDNTETDKPPRMVRNMNPWTAVDNLVGAEKDLSNWSGLIESPMVEEWETLTAETESAVQFIVSCVAVDFKPKDAESG